MTDPTQTIDTDRGAFEAGTILGNRFRLERLVGLGGMGTVYLAHDQQLDIPVAVKTLHTRHVQSEELQERFRRELLAARKIQHPNVVRVHDMLLVANDVLIISMEWIDGITLRQHIADHAPLAVDDALPILRQLTEALGAVHAAGVVHRDLKPDNVMLTADGRVVLTDFGLARLAHQEGLTRPGRLLGTPDYLAPEQAAGEAVDHRADLYALGIIAVEILTGRLPFTATTPSEAISQRLAGSPVPLARADNIPEKMRTSVHALLKREPEQRPADAEAILALWSDKEPVPQQARSSSKIAATVIIALVAMAAAGYIFREDLFSNSGSSTPDPGSIPASAENPVAGQIILPTATSEQAIAATLILTEQANRQRPGPSTFPDAWSLANWYALENASGQRVEVLRDRLLQRFGSPTPVSMPESTPDANADALVMSDLLRDLKNGDFKSAHDGARDIASSDFVFPHALSFVKARSAIKLGQYDDADTILSNQPTTDALLPGYGRMLAALGKELVEDYDGAEQTLQSLVDDFPDDLFVRALKAEFDGDGGDFEAADRALAGILEDDPTLAYAWFLRAKFAILSGNHRVAIDQFLIQAEVLHSRLDNRFGLADTLNAQGIAFERLGRLEEATSRFERALDIRRQVGDLRGEAATLRNLAAATAITEGSDPALVLLDQAADLLEDLGDMAGLAAVENERGMIAEEGSQLGEALTSYQSALRRRRDAGDDYGFAESAINVGFVYYLRGETDNATVYANQALDKFNQLEAVTGVIRAQQLLALLDARSGQFASAAQRLDNTIAAARDGQMVEELAVSLLQQGDLLSLTGNFDSARQALEESSDLFAQRGDLRGQVEVALSSAQSALHRGEPAAARASLDELSQAHSLRPEQAAEKLVLLASIDLKHGNPDSAIVHAEQALEILEGAERPQIAARAELIRIDLSSSLDGYQNLLELVESTGDRLLKAQVLDQATRHALRLGKIEGAVQYANDLDRLLRRIEPFVNTVEYRQTVESANE